MREVCDPYKKQSDCILSPLVLIFIKDPLFAFENTLSDPSVLPNRCKVKFLFYADDLVILSQSKTGLNIKLPR